MSFQVVSSFWKRDERKEASILSVAIEEENGVVDDEGPLPLSLPLSLLSSTYSSIERIANEWKIHVDAPDSSFLRTSKHLLLAPPPLSPSSLALLYSWRVSLKGQAPSK